MFMNRVDTENTAVNKMDTISILIDVMTYLGNRHQLNEKLYK